METTGDSRLRLPLNASDAELIEAARHWVDRVAGGDYEGALALIVPGDWTPKLVRDVVNGYGIIDEGPQRRKITPVATATALKGDVRVPNHWITRSAVDDGGAGAEVGFQLPINGFWSDLSLVMETLKQGDSLVLELQTIHVL
ncbi:hypothetical protein ACWIGM_04965 [Bosea sp. NPDC055332]